MQLKNQGMAMVLALSAMVIVAGLGTLMFTRTINETRSSGDSAAVVKNLMLARGAMTFAGAFMESTGKTLLSNAAATATQSSTANAWAFGGTQANPNAATVASELDGVATTVQGTFDNVLCGINFAPTGTNATVKLRVFFKSNPAANTACTLAYPSGLTLPEGRFVQGTPRNTGTSAEQTYAIPFVAVSQSELGQYKRNIVLQGEYRFNLARTSFAKYAFFANMRPTGTAFVDRDLIDGPVHSNQYLRFWGSAWFGDRATAVGCTSPTLTTCGTQSQGDYFGQTGSPTFKTVAQIGAAGGPCFGSHCPTFVGNQYNFSSSFIPMPDANQARIQRQAAQGGGALAAAPPLGALPAQPANSGGLYFNGNLSSLNLFAGDNSGNFLSGTAANPPVWSAATFQYVAPCATTCTLFRISPAGVLQQWSGTVAASCSANPAGACTPAGTGTWNAVNNAQGQPITSFNGVIHADGNIAALQGPPRTSISGSSICTATLMAENPNCAPPAVASFSQITVANAGTNNNIIINRDLKYENPPCTGAPTRATVSSPVTLASCTNLTATNILGIYSQNGNTLFGPSSSRPTDLTVHGVVMAGTGTVQVNNPNNNDPGGDVKLLGGMIGNTVGIFLYQNSSTGVQTSGYTRRITYDRRLASGMAPPFFPTTGQSDVLDTFTFTFGQREQVGLQ